MQLDNITGIQLLETVPTLFSYIFSRHGYSQDFRFNHDHSTGMFITKVSSLYYSNSSVLFGAFSKIWVIEDSRAAGCQHKRHLKMLLIKGSKIVKINEWQSFFNYILPGYISHGRFDIWATTSLRWVVNKLLLNCSITRKEPPGKQSSLYTALEERFFLSDIPLFSIYHGLTLWWKKVSSNTRFQGFIICTCIID